MKFRGGGGGYRVWGGGGGCSGFVGMGLGGGGGGGFWVWGCGGLGFMGFGVLGVFRVLGLGGESKKQSRRALNRAIPFNCKS